MSEYSHLQHLRHSQLILPLRRSSQRITLYRVLAYPFRSDQTLRARIDLCNDNWLRSKLEMMQNFKNTIDSFKEKPIIVSLQAKMQTSLACSLRSRPCKQGAASTFRVHCRRWVCADECPVEDGVNELHRQGPGNKFLLGLKRWLRGSQSEVSENIITRSRLTHRLPSITFRNPRISRKVE